MLFKIIASVVVVALAITSMVVYTVQRETIDIDVRVVDRAPDQNPDQSPEAKAAAERAKSALEANAKLYNDILARRTDLTGVAVGLTAVTALLLTVVWLGLGLTALGLGLVLALVAVPLWYLGDRNIPGLGIQARGLSHFILGVVTLAMSFAVLMELLKIIFGGSYPVLAIARNVVHEAVRLKVSLVFIILLIFGLAALPGLLEASTPLRYRVQNFLSYGAGGTFWVIAILVLFLSVGSVAFEQRDRVIWQTMTKPVAPWQYLLGKWLGVVGVAAVLLSVSASGVFLFTEYLRDQTAIGEISPYIAKGGDVISGDREILESEVLAARRAVKPSVPNPDASDLGNQVNERMKRLIASNPGTQDTPEERAEILRSLTEEYFTTYQSIGPAKSQTYNFYGLSRAKRLNQNLSLRYKVQVGGNDPREIYKIAFYFPNQSEPTIKDSPLNIPLVLEVKPSAIDEDGRLQVAIVNGVPEQGIANVNTVFFPPDGLEVFYSAGSYRMNFARVMVILWLKLAFLAMVAVTAATFLSFAVASMVSFGVFLIAEGAGFLWEALKYYDADDKGKIILFRVAVRAVAVPISWTFKFYSNMKPTENLVDGRLVAWSTVLGAAGILGVTTFLLYCIGVAIFRKRELATYSGQ